MNWTSLIVLVLAILLRGIASVKSHKGKHGSDFDFGAYFDFQHCFRWLLHIIAAAVAYINLPEILALVSSYYGEVYSGLMGIGAGIIGYLGYDLIRLAERFSFWLSEKTGFPLKDVVKAKPKVKVVAKKTEEDNQV